LEIDLAGSGAGGIISNYDSELNEEFAVRTGILLASLLIVASEQRASADHEDVAPTAMPIVVTPDWESINERRVVLGNFKLVGRNINEHEMTILLL